MYTVINIRFLRILNTRLDINKKIFDVGKLKAHLINYTMLRFINCCDLIIVYRIYYYVIVVRYLSKAQV